MIDETISEGESNRKLTDGGDLENREPLLMEIDLNVVQHLGLKMYTNLPAVISEYVANAWDAWATEVDIEIPQEVMSEDYEIRIEDNGVGMSWDEVRQKFLSVGRPKREYEGETVEQDGETRPLMGRKGIGKLAGFGVAGLLRIRTRKDGEFVEFELDYDKMLEEAKPDDAEISGETSPTTTKEYTPENIRSGPTDKKDGTIVVLTRLKRDQRPALRYIRQRIARRFSVIGEEFEVRVNDQPVKADERNLKDRCQFLIEFNNHPIEMENPESLDDIYGVTPEDVRIDGWLGTFEKPVPDEIGNGVVVMARGKLAQEPSTFGVAEGGTTGQQALQYLVGEIKADFLDQGDLDLIATDRATFNHEKPPGSDLYYFLQKEIRSFCADWPKKRGRANVKEIQEESSYKNYIEPLDEREKKLADDFLGKLAEGPGYDDEMLEEIASYVSSGVQHKSFSDLVKEIDQSDIADMPKILNLFDKYEVLDALNTLRIVRGRYEAIRKFDRLVESREALDPEFHSFVQDNPWLIDPRWDYLDEEIEIQETLEENFGESADNRVGFIALGDEYSVKIIDVRLPDQVVGVNELNQLKQYVDFVRGLTGTSFVGDRDVEGYIIGERLSDEFSVRQEYERRMKPDDLILRTYEELRRDARQAHQEFIHVIERKVERTGSQMLETELESYTTRKLSEREAD